MDTPAAEPSSYGTFDTLCGVVFSLAVLMLVVGGLLLLGALVANADGATKLAASLVGYGITCFSSGISLLIFSYGGWIFLDLSRNSRLQVQKTDKILKHLAELNPRYEEILKHLAELNPKYEERLKREQEAAQRRAEAERERQAALARQQAESERLARERLAEEERQKALAAEAVRKQEREHRSVEARIEAQREFERILAKARKAYRLSEPAQIEQLTGEICWDIDKLFARLADLDQRFQINLTKEIGDQFAQHQPFKNLNIKLEPA